MSIRIMSTGSIEGRPIEGVVGRQLGVHPRQVQHGGDLAHAVIVRHHLIEAERIEQLPLVLLEPPHHRPPPLLIASGAVNHGSRQPATDFCNKIGTKRTC